MSPNRDWASTLFGSKRIASTHRASASSHLERIRSRLASDSSASAREVEDAGADPSGTPNFAPQAEQNWLPEVITAPQDAQLIFRVDVMGVDLLMKFKSPYARSRPRRV